MLVNRNNLNDLYQGYSAAFNAGFRNAMPEWNKIATQVPSTSAQTRYSWLGQFPRLREWVGDRQLKSITAHDYTITNKVYESTVSVLREVIEDDEYGTLAPMMQELGYAAATHPDEIVFDLLKNGTSSLGFDGQNFFDTDHPVGSTTASNYTAGGSNAWYVLDTSRSLKPLILQMRKPYNFVRKDAETDDNVIYKREFVYGVDARLNGGYGFWQQAYRHNDTLNSTNFDSVYAAMMSRVSDDGRPLGIRPTLLVVGPSNRAAALSVVKVSTLANGASNPNFGAVEVLITDKLP